MKRLFAILLATIVILTVIAGCSKEETGSPAAISTAVVTTSTTAPVLTQEAPLADPIKTGYGPVSGTVIGEAGHEIHVYKGIPYAAPPVGDLRWKPPQPPAAWTGVRECTEYSIAAPQQNPMIPPAFEQSEDCLYLNVQTPAKKASERLPVMVWLHEGGFFFGSGNEPGTNLPGLMQHGVLLVTVNMRLSTLGLLAHPLLSKESPEGASGNYMFLDMIAALKWVQANIANFGGDPGNVTVFGESGGGAKIYELMASPLVKDLFQKAIMESAVTGPGLPTDTSLKDMEALGQTLFAKLGVDKEANPLAAARALPWKDIMSATADTFLTATVDGWFLPESASNIYKEGRQNPVPFIAVANLGEITGPGSPFFLFPDIIPRCTNMLANAGKAGVKGYAAIFEHVPANWKADGAVTTHFMEVPYVFGDMDPGSQQWVVVSWLANAAGAKQPDPGLNDTDRQLSEDMMAMWTQFARTGDPNVSGLAAWPDYTAASDEYLSLDIPLKVKSGFSKIAPVPSSAETGLPPGPNVNGTSQGTGLVDNSPPVVENDVWTGDRTSTTEFQGDMKGTLVDTGITHIGTKTGKITGETEAIFTGTVKGKQGTFTAQGTWVGQMMSMTAGASTGTFTILSGTGELADLNGTFTLGIKFDENGSAGTYSGTLSFGEAPALTPSTPAAPRAYNWEEATNHIGETATVTGPIIDAKDLKEVFGPMADYIVLGMGKKWGETGYVGIALRFDRADINLDLYIGKTISATGKIYRASTGAPAVEVTDVANIEVK